MAIASEEDDGKRTYFTECKFCGAMLKWRIALEQIEQETWQSPPRECWMCSETAVYRWEDLGPTSGGRARGQSA